MAGLKAAAERYVAKRGEIHGHRNVSSLVAHESS
jgi:hypothetical protein